MATSNHRTVELKMILLLSLTTPIPATVMKVLLVDYR